MTYRLHLLSCILVLITVIGYSQSPFCDFNCDDATSRGCFSCDITAIEGDYGSSVWPIGGVIAPPTSEICFPFIMNNGFWHVFIAGSSEISIELTTYNCMGASGLQVQMGIMDGCNGDCVVSFDDCSNINNPVTTLETDALVPGQEYALYVDPCAAIFCDFSISISEAELFEVDDPRLLGVYSECKEECLTEFLCLDGEECYIPNEVTACPGEVLTFYPRHEGNSSTNLGEYDEICSLYPPGYSAEFRYYFNGNNYTVFPGEGIGGSITLTMPAFETTTEVCLDEVYTDCSVSENEACITINIEQEESETFTYKVCAEDVADGWEVPRGPDGLTLENSEIVYLDEVENWNDGCFTFETADEECECPLLQTLCIEVQGAIEPLLHTLYMYDCQFDEDGEYEWEWPNRNEGYTLTNTSTSELITIFENSLELDWEDEYCDTTMLISVKTYDVQGELNQVDCGETNGIGWGEYQFNLDLNFLMQEEYESWPIILENSYEVEWIFCDTGESIPASTGRRSFSAEGQDYELCIMASYEFYDGVWGNPDESPISDLTYCNKIFGPYLLTAGCEDEAVQTCPTFENFRLTYDGAVLPVAPGGVIDLYEGSEISVLLSENNLPQGTIDWKISDNPEFNPETEGEIISSSRIESNWPSDLEGPELLAINYRDPEYNSEYFIVGTGAGIRLDQFSITADCDVDCNPDCLPNRTISSWSDQVAVNLLYGCSDIIPVGVNDVVPPNSILIAFIDGYENQFGRSVEKFCSLEGCVYVTVAQEPRCYDAFSDEGAASYTLITAPGVTSTLSYEAQPDGGSVNSRGDYFSSAETLPEIYPTRIEITAEVSAASFQLSCPENSGRQYVKGIVKSDHFHYDCCTAVTPTFIFDLECEDEPVTPPGDDEIFIDFPWLTGLVDQNDCEGVIITVYAQGIYNYIHVETPSGGTLYFQDGTRYCSDTATFSCVDAYNLGAPTDTWKCGDGGGSNPPGPGTDQEIFSDFPFLSSLIDVDDCEGTTVSVYAQGVYNFIHVQTLDSGILYFQDGTLYCTDSANFSCVNAYGFGAPISVWNCNDGGGNPPLGPNFLPDFLWLDDVVDFSDCNGTSVFIYARGAYSYVFVEENGLMTMYNGSGQFYCQDAPGFSCLSAYGFTSADLIEEWSCVGLVGDLPIEKRAVVEEDLIVNVYPNPSSGIFNLDLNVDSSSIEIFDVNGRSCLEHENETNNCIIDLRQFSEGIYIIKISSERGYELKRVLKI